MSIPGMAPPENRQLLTKSIYLIGPQSTGKTTLAKALVNYYGGGETVPIIQETARKILASKGYTAADLLSSRCLQMQLDIFEAHYYEEKEMFAQGKFCFISDRSAIDPIIYTQKYSSGGAGSGGSADDWKTLYSSQKWSTLAERYRDSKSCLIILLQPIKQFLVNDGTRKMPSSWAEMEELGRLFQEFLIRERIPFHMLDETCTELSERVAKVVGLVNS